MKYLALFCIVGWSETASAQVSTVVREGAESVIAAVGRTTARTGGELATEQLARAGGRDAVEAVCANVVREGGETALKDMAVLVERTGVGTIMALKNVASPAAMIAPLKELPVELATKAAGRLAAGAEGRALGQLTERFGAAALRAEALNPGVGMVVIRELGADGVALAAKLTPSQMQQLAVISREVAALPGAEKATVMKAIGQNASGFFGWVGELVKANPGKVILTTGAVVELDRHWDSLIGTSSSPGIITQGVSNVVDKALPGFGHLVDWGVPVLLMGLALWIWLKLRHVQSMHDIAREKARRKAEKV